MSGFMCPFCKQVMSLSDTTRYQKTLAFNNEHPRPSEPHLTIEIFRCPNCSKESIFAYGSNGYIENHFSYVYPGSNSIKFPEYVPSAIRFDYEEACSILFTSPKASATLSRRCLQGIIRDFWSITGKGSLAQEIDAIKDKIPAAQWAAIDALRKIGNIGAHMEKDVNFIIDVEPGEAENLIKLVELLIDKWYIARNDEEQLYREIVASGKAKSAAHHPK